MPLYRVHSRVYVTAESPRQAADSVRASMPNSTAVDRVEMPRPESMKGNEDMALLALNNPRRVAELVSGTWQHAYAFGDAVPCSSPCEALARGDGERCVVLQWQNDNWIALATIDVTRLLETFARERIHTMLDLWPDAPPEVRLWLKTGDPQARSVAKQKADLAAATKTSLKPYPICQAVVTVGLDPATQPAPPCETSPTFDGKRHATILADGLAASASLALARAVAALAGDQSTVQRAWHVVWETIRAASWYAASETAAAANHLPPVESWEIETPENWCLAWRRSWTVVDAQLRDLLDTTLQNPR